MSRYEQRMYKYLSRRPFYLFTLGQIFWTKLCVSMIYSFVLRTSFDFINRIRPLCTAVLRSTISDEWPISATKPAAVSFRSTDCIASPFPTPGQKRDILVVSEALGRVVCNNRESHKSASEQTLAPVKTQSPVEEPVHSCISRSEALVQEM